jgi:hypothetical protein
MIRTLHEGLLADGITVPLAKLCAWFGVPRRAAYNKPTKAAPRVDPRFAILSIKVPPATIAAPSGTTQRRSTGNKGEALSRSAPWNQIPSTIKLIGFHCMPAPEQGSKWAINRSIQRLLIPS